MSLFCINHLLGMEPKSKSGLFYQWDSLGEIASSIQFEISSLLKMSQLLSALAHHLVKNCAGPVSAAKVSVSLYVCHLCIFSRALIPWCLTSGSYTLSTSFAAEFPDPCREDFMETCRLELRVPIPRSFPPDFCLAVGISICSHLPLEEAFLMMAEPKALINQYGRRWVYFKCY